MTFVRKKTQLILYHEIVSLSLDDSDNDENKSADIQAKQVVKRPIPLPPGRP